MTDHGAVDRRVLTREMPEKTSRWPRTTRRQERVRQVLSRRQPDLTVVLENVHDPHNVSAILRSCDAVGVLKAHVIYSVETPPDELFSRQTSASAAKWVDVEQHASVGACYERLRADGLTILATALGPGAKSPFEWELAEPVALVFGNEMRGVSPEALALADGAIEIPMMGMVQSLNVSVACAVCLYEAYRQRAATGAYDQPRLSQEKFESLEQEWLHR